MTALEVKDLTVEFRLPSATYQVVRKLSYHVGRGETLGIVGESGSGKTVAAYAVLGVLDSPPSHVAGGQVWLQGQELLSMDERSRRLIRGRSIALVGQNSSLNPTFTVGWQLAEPFRVHLGMSRGDALREAAKLLDRVGIPSRKRRLDSYPHQFSGGMRQRINIAMALALHPAVIIADEPTTALDVTVQWQIMKLFHELQEESGTALVLITHDLGLIAENSDRLAVMYAGSICESGPTARVLENPAHAYTQALLESLPGSGQARLKPIDGAPPDPRSMPAGCPFHPRCRHAEASCAEAVAQLVAVGPGRTSACQFADRLMLSVQDGAHAPG